MYVYTYTSVQQRHEQQPRIWHLNSHRVVRACCHSMRLICGGTREYFDIRMPSTYVYPSWLVPVIACVVNVRIPVIACVVNVRIPVIACVVNVRIPGK